MCQVVAFCFVLRQAQLTFKFTDGISNKIWVFGQVKRLHSQLSQSLLPGTGLLLRRGYAARAWLRTNAVLPIHDVYVRSGVYFCRGGGCEEMLYVIYSWMGWMAVSGKVELFVVRVVWPVVVWWCGIIVVVYYYYYCYLLCSILCKLTILGRRWSRILVVQYSIFLRCRD